MREFSGSLAGRPWQGWMPERTAELDYFYAWVRRQSGPVAVDSEGKGLQILCGDPDYLRLIQFGTETEAWVIPVELGGEFREAARWAVECLPDQTGHNAHGFDLLAFSTYLGVDYAALCRKTTDTMLLARLIDPRQRKEGGIGAGLKPLSDHFIDSSAADTQNDLTSVFRSLGLSKATGWAGIDLFHPVYTEYAALDVILTSRLRPLLIAELDRLGVPQRLRDYEHEIARICGSMQLRGMVLDVGYTRSLSERLGCEADEWTATARRYGVEKLGSPRQLADAFVALGETLSERTDNGAVKVDKSVLCRLADVDFQSGEPLHTRTPNPLAEAVMKAKRAAKWQSAYADQFLANVDRDGRIHPGIQTMAARTGRMSVTNPAVQTLPSGDSMIRRCFLAEDGHVMVSTDFQAVELRVLAALADVRRMKDAIKSGSDLHSYTAGLVFGEGFTSRHRKVSKAIGFGKVYGGGAATVSRQTGAPESDVRRAMATYDRVYPEIRRFAERKRLEACDNGMTSVSVTGRRLPLDRDRTYAVVNYQVQSAARDVLGQSLVQMDAAGLTPYLRLPVHDEVLVSAPSGEAVEVAREVERCMTFDLYGVQIDAASDIGALSWGSLYGASV